MGSLEETFNQYLIRGANFICLDNIRGKVDSPAIESFLTEESYSARVPYQPAVEIDPRRVIIQMTSNKADITVDLANRSACVRILKRSESDPYKTYPEGDILEHVRARQPEFLGAVFAIIRAWYAAGQPRTLETRHDFREWAQVLDWIVQHLLCSAPLLDGHRDTQLRMTSPVLNWLRDVALTVKRAGQCGQVLRACDILTLISEAPDLEIPGLAEGSDLGDETVRKAVLQAVGRKLALCFKSGDQVLIDDITIRRQTQHDSEGRRDLRAYVFESAPIAGGNSGAIGANRTLFAAQAELGIVGSSAEPSAEATKAASCAYTPPICAYGAPIGESAIGAASKALSSQELHSTTDDFAPNAPKGPQQTEFSASTALNENINIKSMTMISPITSPYFSLSPPLGALGAIGANGVEEGGDNPDPYPCEEGVIL